MEPITRSNQSGDGWRAFIASCSSRTVSSNAVIRCSRVAWGIGYPSLSLFMVASRGGEAIRAFFPRGAEGVCGGVAFVGLGLITWRLLALPANSRDVRCEELGSVMLPLLVDICQTTPAPLYG